MSLPPDPTAVPANVLPETEARTLLRACPAGDGLEAWLADQPWHAATDGSWLVERDREGWTYRVEGVPGRVVRVVARSPESGSITSWLVAP
jgi:hypothetical protein